MHKRYNRHKAKAASERGRRMARARWDRDRERREAEAPARLRAIRDEEAIHPPIAEGDAFGMLEWRDFRSGTVKRWRVLRGDRIDRVILEAMDGRRTKPHGWTWILDHLRGYLAGRKA